jgi:hypothetical protein
MHRLAVMAASVLLTGLLLPVPSAQAEPRVNVPWRVGGAVGGGGYVFIPYLFPLGETSAEVVLGDRVAIGGQAVFALGEMGGAMFVPFVSLGSPRSRPSAGYLTLAWVPGSTLGTLGVGYEAVLRGPVRLYGEAGVVGTFDFQGALPYGHLGVRLRF